MTRIFIQNFGDGAIYKTGAGYAVEVNGVIALGSTISEALERYQYGIQAQAQEEQEIAPPKPKRRKRKVSK